MKNKYLKHARVPEHEFRSILELFCADVKALKVSQITGVNKNTTHRIYGLLRKRVVELARAEAAPFPLPGVCKWMKATSDLAGFVAFEDAARRGRFQLSAFSKGEEESSVPSLAQLLEKRTSADD